MRDLALKLTEFAPLRAGRWLVAVSGGGDSVALLKLLLEAGFQDRIVVGNFNHGWGDFGDESEDFVRHIAKGLKLDVVVGQGGGKAATNAEAVARAERMGWFVQVCVEMGLQGVVIAHTQDDVVEGFLMRAGKGSALGGLAGMKEVTEVQGIKLMRPLLGVGRDELRSYLQEINQSWMEDPDNVAGGSQRARLRKLIFGLEQAGVMRQGVASTVAALTAAEEVVEGIAEGIAVKVEGGAVLVARKDMVEAKMEIGVRIVARMMRALGEDGMIVRRGKRVRLWEKIVEDSEGVATLGGVKFVWGEGTVRGEREGG